MVVSILRNVNKDQNLAATFYGKPTRANNGCSILSPILPDLTSPELGILGGAIALGKVILILQLAQLALPSPTAVDPLLSLPLLCNFGQRLLPL